MPVRELTPTDALAYRLLTSSAFGGSVDPDDPAASAPLSPGQTALGIDSAALPGGAEGVLAAAARIRHDEISLGGGRVRCGGIAGLAVHPAHRGDGLVAELLAAVLARCDEESLPVSMLYPSNPEIYRRHGYQVVARVETLEVPLVDLQRRGAGPARRTVRVPARCRPRGGALTADRTAGDNAMLRRHGPLFPDGLPGHGWEAVLLVGADGLDRGYASWTRRRGEGSGLEVHEVLGRDREDLRALLRVIGSWSTVTESVRLRVRTEDPVLDVLPGGGPRPPRRCAAGGTSAEPRCRPMRHPVHRRQRCHRSRDCRWSADHLTSRRWSDRQTVNRLRPSHQHHRRHRTARWWVRQRGRRRTGHHHRYRSAGSGFLPPIRTCHRLPCRRQLHQSPSRRRELMLPLRHRRVPPPPCHRQRRQ